MELKVTCRQCKKEHTVEVQDKDYEDWKNRVGAKRHAQVAFPYLSAGDRELLISQTCDACFQKMFPPEEDEE